MGFLDSILGGSKKAEVPKVHASGKPFRIATKFIPMRMSSMKDGKIDLEVKITNNTREEQMVSVDGLLPKKKLIGFDPTCLNKHVEKRLGNVSPGETKTIHMTIWGSHQTSEGNYPMILTVYSHYLTYERVLNYMKKDVTIRVV